VGPWLFILMINKLVIQDVNKWKDADDTIAEIVTHNNKSNAQIAINAVDDWSGENLMQLRHGTDMCKELLIDFKLIRHSFKSLSVKALFQIVVS
jgi:hypothetical protein